MLVGAAAAIALSGPVARSASADPFLATFDNAYLKTVAFPDPGQDVLDAPPEAPAEISGELNLATGAFTGGSLGAGWVTTSTVAGVGVQLTFEATEAITGALDTATGSLTTNPAAYLATAVVDYNPEIEGDEDTCVIGDEPGLPDTPDLTLVFSTEADYPSPYKGDRFTLDIPNLATEALNGGALVAAWESMPAGIRTAGPGNCSFIDALAGSPGALWMANGIATPTLTSAPLATPESTPETTPGGAPVAAPTSPPLPPPAYGRTVNAQKVSGTVLVRLPGSHRFVRLDGAEAIPVGSSVDTTRGRVRLTSAKTRDGETQTADFYSGRFKVLQPKRGKPLTELRLEGFKSNRCRRNSRGGARQSKRGKGGKGPRGLWGNGKGNYRSRGRHGSATVRGTIWLTEERCNGTFFKVRRGTVTVRDFTRRKTRRIGPGGHYLAPAPR